MKTLSNKKGFTLIEVVLVLAIAGLIMLIVFLAVSGTQKARRDTQRKNDLGRVVAALEQYASNNNSAYPVDQAAFAGAGFAGSYLTTNYNDPLSGTVYQWTAARTPTSANSAGFTYAVVGRVFTVCVSLEQATNQCQNNQ